MATLAFVNATNNADIDGLLSGRKWSGTITYSFPDSSSDYIANYSTRNEPTTSGFSAAPVQMQWATTYAVGLINSYTNANISYAGTNGADIMIAQSPQANPTSYAYYPSGSASGGDVWFGTSYNYSLASLGNYYFATALHELGHAVGLKHSQETGGVADVAVPTAHDHSEYTVMSYRSYAGAPLDGYTAEAYGFPQTYMANDILALQVLYGANYSTQSGNTTYTWSPTTGQQFINGVGQPVPGGGTAGTAANRIFETVWDGGGIDTYDLSNYTTNLTLNLNPGAASTFSSTQIAYLGNGNYASGNVYNAYLFDNDARSYIDNAIGGSGNDTITGNAIANRLTGGAGVDSLWGGGGADTFVFRLGDSAPAAGQHDRINDFIAGDKIDVSAIDAISGTGAIDQFRFLGAVAFDGAAGALIYSYNSVTNFTTLSGDTNGDRVADFSIDLVGNIALTSGDIISAQTITTIIEAAGATKLVQEGSNYFLNPVAGGTGPTLKYGGNAVVAGQFGAYIPLGVEAVSGGYEVAWKNTSTGQYSIWSTDSTGNYTGNYYQPGPGNSSAFQSFEPSFGQDLNGDGIIGPPSTPTPSTTTIEAVGGTKLVQSGSNYLLNPAASGTGPTLKYGGNAVVAGQFGAYVPLGVEAVSGGYEVAWKNTSTGQYSIWSIDSTGNYTGNYYQPGPGNSSAFQSFEPSFGQDLNGDGTIGVPAAPAIESFGATKLVQTGSNYYLNPVAGGTGPTLKYGGSVVVAGQFGAYVPIGVEAVSGGGYEVAWKNTSTGQYSIWSTDSSGNYTGNYYQPGSGTSSAFKAFEPSFQQDLNGDGVIGNGTGQATISGDSFLFASAPAQQSCLGALDVLADSVRGQQTHIAEALEVVEKILSWVEAHAGGEHNLSHDLQGGFVLPHY